MSLSKKATSKDESDLKEYTAAAEAEPKTDVKGLQKALQEKGVDFSQFSIGDENYRKRSLKDAYAEFKTKYGWLYDQPIKADVQQ